MTRYADLPRNVLYFMHWIKALQKRPDKSVHVVVTSWPYYGQRSYGGDNSLPEEIGQEKTPFEYLQVLVEGCREIKRVLRDDGTFWYNMGDCDYQGQQFLFPARVAIALSGEGWLVRRENIWSKRNTIPKGFRDKGCLPGNQGQKVTNRTKLAHEQVYMLSKGPVYYYDAEAIGKPYSPATLAELKQKYTGQGTKDFEAQGVENSSDAKRRIVEALVEKGWANRRSVWPINAKPHKGAHTATFPPKLPWIAISAGTSAKGCCPECGAFWVPTFSKTRIATRPARRSKTTGMTAKQMGSRDLERHVTIETKTGWAPSCSCGCPNPVPCTVLDPFMGSGTTAEVAAALKRYCIGSELYSTDNLQSLKDRLGLYWTVGHWTTQEEEEVKT
jgi:DNA modification methylase